VTSKKLRQMRFAAELYSARYPYTYDLRMAVVTVDRKIHIELFEID